MDDDAIDRAWDDKREQDMLRESQLRLMTQWYVHQEETPIAGFTYWTDAVEFCAMIAKKYPHIADEFKVVERD